MNELAQFKMAGWADMMRQRNDSGLSVKEWCAENGMSINAYYYRVKKLREAALENMRGTAGQPAQFAKVTLPGSSQTAAPLTIRCGNVTMEVSNDASDGILALAREVVLGAV